MKIIIDIEGNGLRPDKIWCVVCRDIDTNDLHIFRNVTHDAEERTKFLAFAERVTLWVGHNILGYDLPVLADLLNLHVPVDAVVDTLIVSKLVDYPRKGHSLEDYGAEFGVDKNLYSDWSQWSQELENRCVTDTLINLKVYHKYLRVINGTSWQPSLRLEHEFQLVVNDLSTKGFSFNVDKGTKLLHKVLKELAEIDEGMAASFPPREVLIREFTPKATKHGTINRTSVPKALWDKIEEFEVGQTYRHTKLEPFNPASHQQIIEVLNEAGWKPTDKTQTHIEAERELSRLKYAKNKSTEVDLRISELYNKINNGKKPLKTYGWKVNETNLQTLPDTAPKHAKSLAKRILLESRRRTLTEWLELVQDDGRIHGKFYGIGAWTHRMAHQNPNTANIPTGAKLYGDEMRSLWRAPRNRLLVGVDAEGIQLRIFAHYINDPEFTESLVKGKKDDKSDPHSLNQRILGARSRNSAKRFIFAYLLGAGIGKLAEVLEFSENEAQGALERLMDRYKGLQELKASVIPADAKRGWFVGLDGRKVPIPGDTEGSRKHLCMSGYLQNGEAVVMKKATVKFAPKLEEYDAFLVDLVHDEWQSETPNNMAIALKVAKLKADSLREVGEELNLNCPLAGSYWNDDLKDYSIGTNWKVTH